MDWLITGRGGAANAIELQPLSKLYFAELVFGLNAAAHQFNEIDPGVTEPRDLRGWPGSWPAIQPY